MDTERESKLFKKSQPQSQPYQIYSNLISETYLLITGVIIIQTHKIAIWHSNNEWSFK